VSPTPRLALLLAATALGFLFLPPALPALIAVVLLATAAGDALAVRRPPRVERSLPGILARGVPATVVVDVEAGGAATRVRQPVPPDLDLDPREADGSLTATVVPRRRGRHALPAPAVRVEGRFGLGRVNHRLGEEADVLVYPDMPAAYRLVVAVRQGRFRDPGVLTRGPLGLGTDFEQVRDYLPDDDIRQVNWRASARTGRPMSNQYRVEQDRNVICCIDAGRLMAAPVSAAPGAAVPLTRLDAALDAAVAVALVADEIGDQAGAIAFDRVIRRRLSPRRRGGQAVVGAIFDLEPTTADSDYELAFRSLGGGNRVHHRSGQHQDHQYQPVRTGEPSHPRLPLAHLQISFQADQVHTPADSDESVEFPSRTNGYLRESYTQTTKFEPGPRETPEL